jgi:hypothetical protein
VSEKRNERLFLVTPSGSCLHSLHRLPKQMNPQSVKMDIRVSNAAKPQCFVESNFFVKTRFCKNTPET